MAIAGIVLSVLSIVIGIVAAIVIGIFVSAVQDVVQECRGLSGQELDQCIERHLPGQQQPLGLDAPRVVIER